MLDFSSNISFPILYARRPPNADNDDDDDNVMLVCLMIQIGLVITTDTWKLFLSEIIIIMKALRSRTTKKNNM